jgi:hypothetical protein
MQVKVTKTLFLVAIVALVLSSTYQCLAQASGLPTSKPIKSSDQPAVFDDTQWSPDEDTQLLKKDLKSQRNRSLLRT